MNIMFLDGSPRAKDSASAFILTALEKKLSVGPIPWHAARKPEMNRLVQEIKTCDVLVIAFPLYVDAIPSHLLKVLEALESSFSNKEKQVTVYALVNCGFHESRQNRHALAMTRIWAEKCGFLWGQGLGIGAGEMVKSVPMGRGPAANLSKALDSLAQQMPAGLPQEDLFIDPNLPKFLYKAMANHIGWPMQAKSNGISRKAIRDKLPLVIE